MKVFILAAGQGTRLRPLTDNQPKCMVQINGISIIRRQLQTMRACGISEQDIYIICGYKQEVLRKHLEGTQVNFIVNYEYETTNMVCSLMCAEQFLEGNVIVSYGDIIYSTQVLRSLMDSIAQLSVVVDDGWYDYWSERCDDPTSDAETLKFSESGFIKEIGQKTTNIKDIESQYIGLMKFTDEGTQQILNLCKQARLRTEEGRSLWRTNRDYAKMYMTDLWQGLIDEGHLVKPVHIDRDWFEVDNPDDLAVAEKYLMTKGELQ